MIKATFAAVIGLLSPTPAQAQQVVVTSWDMSSGHALVIYWETAQDLEDWLIVTGALDGPLSGGPSDPPIESLVSDGSIVLPMMSADPGADVDQICAPMVAEFELGTIDSIQLSEQCGAAVYDTFRDLDPPLFEIVVKDPISNGI